MKIPGACSFRGGRSIAVFRVVAGLWVVLIALLHVPSRADTSAAARQTEMDFTRMTLEELMGVEVTSVGKKVQKLSDAAAAIFVITQEDIRRSGVTTIAEALRMAPGLEVAHIDANKWAISSRGFNNQFANKLLVLIDGRSVYTPLFSGVFWDVQDTLLEDIDRIEVIRGPGATLWGANAVNGVINIITKAAHETQGGLLNAGGGTEERGVGGVRYGVQLDEQAHARVYVKYFRRDGFVSATGDDTPDDWHMLRGGFRLDWQASDYDAVTLQGDVYDGEAGNAFVLASLQPPFLLTQPDDARLFGGNLLLRWRHTISPTSDVTVQTYYDRTERQDITEDTTHDTIDFDAQHRFTLGRRHGIVWGFSYRFVHDRLADTFTGTFTPMRRDTHLFSAFVQDDIVLLDDYLRATLGLKFEHNDFTGFEVQPNVRLLWTPHPLHTIWAAVSRAVRTPSRFEHDVRANLAVTPPGTPLNPGPLPALTALFGNEDFGSEELLAYELGYRTQLLPHLSIDIAAFYNIYEHLRTVRTGMPFVETSRGVTHIVVPLIVSNDTEGESYGVEVAADWRPLDWWRLQWAYSYLQLNLRLPDSLGGSLAASEEGSSPQHQFSLRSWLDLPWHLQLDVWLRYVDRLPSLDVDRYVTLTVRLAWSPLKNLELSIVGQNLIERQHREFGSNLSLPTEVERSVHGKLVWRF